MTTAQIEADTTTKKEYRESTLGETIKTIIYAVIIAFVVRTFFFEPFNIPSGSMKPTLLVGDYLFVSKMSFGYSKYSIAYGIDLFDGRILEHLPERGDVAVFKKPPANKTDYIKRIIGLPGDTIRIEDEMVILNDKPLPRARIADFTDFDRRGDQRTYRRYMETLPGGKRYTVIEERHGAPLDNTETFTVPAGHIFVMGDNRDNSLDSRDDVGYVPMENLVGRAERLFFSIDQDTRFWQLWKWPMAIRYSRLFDKIV